MNPFMLTGCVCMFSHTNTRKQTHKNTHGRTHKHTQKKKKLHACTCTIVLSEVSNRASCTFTRKYSHTHTHTHAHTHTHNTIHIHACTRTIVLSDVSNRASCTFTPSPAAQKSVRPSSTRSNGVKSSRIGGKLGTIWREERSYRW
jgi:hypothetical protein